jgi:hypothetical protein
MKKIYTTALMLVAGAVAVLAQGNEQAPSKEWNTSKYADRINISEFARGGGVACALDEGFDSAIPASWDNIMTNANENWTWTGTGGNPDGRIDCQYDASLGQQDESIITDSIDLSSLTAPGLYFDWFMSYYWGVTPNDNYDLTVSITTDNGANWTDLWTEADAGEFDSYTWYTKQVDLSAYASETGAQFRFNYNGADGAQAAFDNIKVCDLPANDLVLNAVYGGDNINDYLYSMIPTSQAVEVIAGAVATNFGVATQNNVSYDWELLLDGSSVASGTEAGAAMLMPGGMDTVWISTGYTPSTVGELTVSIEVSADETEQVPDDNSGEVSIMYTDYVWGHDHEDGDYFELGYAATDANGAQGFEMGARYFCQVDGDMIYALQFALGSSTTATSIVVKVYENDPALGPVSETVYDIMPGDLSSGSVNIMTVVLDDAVAMSSGSVYTATVEISAGDDGYILGNGDDDGDGGQALYLGTDGSWYNWIGLTTSMRLNLDATTDVQENEAVSGVYMYPNPANENLTVGFVSKAGEDLTVNILGVDGALVASEQLATKAGQSSTVTFNVENLAAGMYMVQIEGAKSSLTQRVVVQ